MAAPFPPDTEKYPRPSDTDDLRLFLDRLVGHLNDYEDHDLTFVGPVFPETLAVVHGLGRIPREFTVIYKDNNTVIHADPTLEWGYNVVYFQAQAAALVRIRLR